jgi:hypothetical protein
VKAAPERVAAAPLQVTAATPERASVTVPATVRAGEPRLAPSAGVATAIAGGVLSRLTSTLALDVFPARSVAVPVTTWRLPSAVSSIGGVQVAIPLRLSAQSKLTFTSRLCQPAALGVGSTAAETVGGSGSTP